MSAFRFSRKGAVETGCDCWGLVCLIYRRELGIALPQYADLYRDANETLSVCKGFERSHRRPLQAGAGFAQQRPSIAFVVRMRGSADSRRGLLRKDRRAALDDSHNPGAGPVVHIEPIFDPMKPARHPTFWRHKSRSEAA